ncbi:hypothetical protein RRV45_15715 [Bacillus sp. DTU_2020_1000418_1_SI_GHA_SEK_038]|nr:hypothetical protein [Bacillus sp. DTU_2020_1000418_1_SI_GHA_SEK_038]WNS74352.1 hypothetical protein RRV45_15715 [Bacillus sp. DTU_2020_1000418_1_SI_GHA_SEK_038]
MKKRILVQLGAKLLLNKVKPPADASDFLKEIIGLCPIKIWAQIRPGGFD